MLQLVTAASLAPSGLLLGGDPLRQSTSPQAASSPAEHEIEILQHESQTGTVVPRIAPPSAPPKPAAEACRDHRSQRSSLPRSKSLHYHCENIKSRHRCRARPFYCPLDGVVIGRIDQAKRGSPALRGVLNLSFWRIRSLQSASCAALSPNGNYESK